jgi:hypothetical protein
MRIHVFVISWEGKHDAAESIVSACTSADYRTVIYSNKDEKEETGTGEWIQVPNAHFFGRKFEAALNAFKPNADIFFLIQADVVSDQWNVILEACRKAFEDDQVGVWAPSVDWTWWTNERVGMGRTPTGLIVAQTDGIVMSCRASTVSALQKLDYSCNNLGWGVEWPVITHAYTEGRLAFRNADLWVKHPPGSGYDHREARSQMNAFLAQLPPHEQTRMNMLLHYAIRPK